jgi:Protein of unknown function (DUF2442)
MNPRVKSVEAMDDFRLFLIFNNDEEKIFDCKPYLDKGIFKLLGNKSYFASVRIMDDTVVWPDEQDFCPDTLYLDSTIKHTESS